ncbi:type II toxin-antitoxin system HicA family toxin [Turneriella parva]|uniref:YcfA family protein n=1 Tax=Turneriella parva (strain ATCC BAA-1111 / DSM 21527 / NCTC 11395 / H) TaxID=869212 RepID=I4B2J0_TURPD|nr:YcfA family protein [Turneriella parva DSM 21527]
MRAISGKKFCKILENKGWVLKKISGSHQIYMKEGREDRISVPVHSNQDLKIGLLRHHMKVAGIVEEEL